MWLGLFMALCWQCWSVSGGPCVTPRGEVAWWAIYRHHNTHLYLTINSRTDDVTDILQPWSRNSPLRLTIENSGIGSSGVDYLTYTSDGDIPILERIPSYYNLQGGMLVQDFGYGILPSSGFWLIHNNTFFPPRRGASLPDPRDPAWQAASTDDPSLSLVPFYFCISIRGHDQLNNIADQLLLTNPSVIISRLENKFWKDKLKKNPVPNTGFPYMAAVQGAYTCFKSGASELARNCLQVYGDPAEGLYVLTRMRSLTIHWVNTCLQMIQNHAVYTGPVWNLQYDPSHGTNVHVPKKAHSVFAITTSLVCLGNNVAANPDGTALMICVVHPRLAQWLTANGRGMDMSCQATLLNQLRQGIGYNTVQSKHLQQHLDNIGVQISPNYKYGADVNHGGPTYRDFEPQDFVQEMRPKEVLYLDRNLELNDYLFENERAIMGVFCRRGCRFCDTMTDKLHRVAQALWTVFDIDVVVVDINTLGLPTELASVDWTPFVRYRAAGGNHMPWHVFSVGLPDPEEAIQSIQKIQSRSKRETDGDDWDAGDDEDEDLIRDEASSAGTGHKRVKRGSGIKQNNEGRYFPAAGKTRACNNGGNQGPPKNGGNQGRPKNNPQMPPACRSSRNVRIEDIEISKLKDSIPEREGRKIKDVRLMFAIPSKAMVTLLKANLACNFNGEVRTIYRAVCSNSDSRHAEENLLQTIKYDKQHIQAKTKGTKSCTIELRINNSPCFDKCSGASNTEGGGNIQKVKQQLEDFGLNLDIFEIAFVRAYGRKHNDESHDWWKPALKKLLERGYQLKRCHFDTNWWNQLKGNTQDTNVAYHQKDSDRRYKQLERDLEKANLDDKVPPSNVPCIPATL